MLLATASPKSAMLGICGCGEAGCGSLWVRVRRDGDIVLWEPDPRTPSWTIESTYRFQLRAYLDAVDAGQRTTHAWESRARRLARELRQRRDSLHGFTMVDLSELVSVRLLDVGATAGGDLLLSVATSSGRHEELTNG